MNNKPWYKSHIIWVAILTGVSGAIGVIASAHPDISWIAMAQSVVLMFMRYNTNSTIS